TGASTPATPNAQRRLHPGSSTTTISAATPHSEATPPPTGCHQRDGRVQLARRRPPGPPGYPGRVPDPATYRPASGSVPPEPGVYRFRDVHDRVIYVGKAKNLRNRLNSYFADLASLHPRTQQMVT